MFTQQDIELMEQYAQNNCTDFDTIAGLSVDENSVLIMGTRNRKPYERYMMESEQMQAFNQLKV